MVFSIWRYERVTAGYVSVRGVAEEGFNIVQLIKLLYQ